MNSEHPASPESLVSPDSGASDAYSGKEVAAPGLRQPRTETRLDSYTDYYADRTHTMRASAIRALFAVANRPEVVSLAGGMPNIADLPLNAVGSVIDQMVVSDGTKALQYGSGQGEPMIREQICEVMAEEGISAHSDDVVVTVGSQQGLDLITKIFCNPGDIVLAEAPSYVGALTTFQSYQVETVQIPIDEYGLDPQALREVLQFLQAKGTRPKFCYTIPNFQNPAGVTQTLVRRKELLAIAEEFDLLLVEDNPYGLLNLEGDRIAAMRSLNQDRILYLGSFSKTFAPGFRVGWVLAPHAVKQKLVLAQEAATLSPPVFSQYAVSAYLDKMDWRGQIESFKTMYRSRRDEMLNSLAEEMPAGAEWTRPRGGFFVWLTLPEGLDSQAMLARAVSSRVAYVPGTAFYTDGLGSRNMRLSFCYPTEDRIREGVRRLAAVINSELELRSTFGVTSKSATNERNLDGGRPTPNQL